MASSDVVKIGRAGGLWILETDCQARSPESAGKWRIKCITQIVSSSAQAQRPFVYLLGSPFGLAWIWLRPSRLDDALISRWLSMLAAMLTPLAVVVGALGVWRLGADPGWTSDFFIAHGLLSHWQVWFAAAIIVRVSSRGLNRWLDKQQ